MLAKPTDNVLPIDSSRPIGQPGRHIGAILMDEGKLTASDAEQVLARQRELGWRFGEAAIRTCARRSPSSTSVPTWYRARRA
jgi:hypothetical protein